jgi:ATP adenylyltransferase
MEYIQRPKGGPCVFCELFARPAEDRRAGLVLLVTPHALVCLNKYPFAACHLLVAPRTHTGSLEDLPGEEYHATMDLVRECATRLRVAVAAQGLNVGLNQGKAGGAGIAEHLHVHVVPRWAGDQSFMPVVADTRVMPEHLDASWERLAPAFADLQREIATPR